MANFDDNCVILSVMCNRNQDSGHTTSFTIKVTPTINNNGVIERVESASHLFSIPSLSWEKNSNQEQLINSIMQAIHTYVETLNG